MCPETEFRTQGYLTLEYLLGAGWWIVKMTKGKKTKKQKTGEKLQCTKQQHPWPLPTGR